MYPYIHITNQESGTWRARIQDKRCAIPNSVQIRKQPSELLPQDVFSGDVVDGKTWDHLAESLQTTVFTVLWHILNQKIYV